MFKHPSVYIMVNDKDGTLHIGAASNLTEELRKQRGNEPEKLVWFELHECLGTAGEHERILKESDADSIRKMIEQTNPNWKDLYKE